MAGHFDYDRDQEREQIGERQVGHEQEEGVDLAGPHATLHVEGAEEHENAVGEVSTVRETRQRVPERVLQERSERVSERVAQKYRREAKCSSNDEERPLEHKEDHVGERQSIQGLVIEGSDDAHKDHFDENRGDQDENSAHLVDREPVQNGDEKVLRVASSLVASWVLFLSIELLASGMDLVRRHTGEERHFFLPFILVAVVGGAPNNTNHVRWQASERLLVEDCPVFVLVREVAGR